MSTHHLTLVHELWRWCHLLRILLAIVARIIHRVVATLHLLLIVLVMVVASMRALEVTPIVDIPWLLVHHLMWKLSTTIHHSIISTRWTTLSATIVGVE